MQPAAHTAGSVGAGVDPDHRARKATVPIRPLNFRELLDAPFALLQADIRSTAGFAGLLVTAGEAVVAALIGLVSHLTGGSEEGTALAALCAALAIAWIIQVTLRGVTVNTGLARAAGMPVTSREALRRTRDQLVPLLLTQLSFTAIGIAVLAPSILLFPLGFVAGLAWFLITYPFCLFGLAWLRARHLVAAPVVFAERTTARTALARSGLLTGSLRMQRTGVVICQRLVLALLTAPLLGLALFVEDISGTHRWPFLILITTTGLVLVVFAEIVESSARVVGYLDLRCRREGMDIRFHPRHGGGR
ncbi:hypothetical protein [Nocardia sp. NPDC019395]|uniref:hypothetical protein n=1 Tax=Nocardia sp. NPDC019395 TaxID=3154686 RepID=UPI0033D721E9